MEDVLHPEMGLAAMPRIRKTGKRGGSSLRRRSSQATADSFAAPINSDGGAQGLAEIQHRVRRMLQLDFGGQDSLDPSDSSRSSGPRHSNNSGIIASSLQVAAIEKRAHSKLRGDAPGISRLQDSSSSDDLAPLLALDDWVP